MVSITISLNFHFLCKIGFCMLTRGHLYLTNVVEVKSGSDSFLIKIRDGKNWRCVHNNPRVGPLPDYAPHRWKWPSSSYYCLYVFLHIMNILH
ncbi:hypothetical protein IHE45_16G052100 [Dioscorea alata]|uniref:Uncharacterized protein n=1 Tax=Dioscorea alata TaxID=55571 RepID=A0ACB7UHL5_DIOAL|nr:hypothetical protein IHE45_16G052100 [Dioscorea alata]